MKLHHRLIAGCATLCLAASASFAQTALPAAPATPAAAQTTQHLRSRMFIYNLRDGSSKLVFTADTIWEAPNWSPDGRYLISNSEGGIYRLTLRPDGSATPQK